MQYIFIILIIGIAEMHVDNIFMRIALFILLIYCLLKFINRDSYGKS
jgi:hypothetical protein